MEATFVGDALRRMWQPARGVWSMSRRGCPQPAVLIPAQAGAGAGGVQQPEQDADDGGRLRGLRRLVETAAPELDGDKDAWLGSELILRQRDCV